MIAGFLLLVFAINPCPDRPALPSGSGCEFNKELRQFVCLLSAVNGTHLDAETVYVAPDTVTGDFVLSNGTRVLGPVKINGSLTVMGGSAAICNVTTKKRVVVAGTSAPFVTIHGVTVNADNVGVMVVGASRSSNLIDVTDLSIADVAVTGDGSPRVTFAAAHATSKTPVTVPCDSSAWVVLQPYLANSNVSAEAGCKQTVDLSTLLAVFGRAYEVSFYDFGANDAGVTAWLRRVGKWVIAIDVLLGLITWINWSAVTKRVKATDDIKEKRD